MTNKFNKIIVTLLTMFLINFITGCMPENCTTPILFYLRDINIKTIDRIEQPDGTVELVQTDTIRNEVAFEVYPTIEIAAAKTKNQYGLMNVAYGDCNSEIALNPILPEKSKMYTNNDFYYDGGFVPAGQNFLEHEGFKEYVNFPTYLSYESTFLITIEDVPLKFFNDAYTFYFEWETNDGTLIKDEVEVHFR